MNVLFQLLYGDEHTTSVYRMILPAEPQSNEPFAIIHGGKVYFEVKHTPELVFWLERSGLPVTDRADRAFEVGRAEYDAWHGRLVRRFSRTAVCFPPDAAGLGFEYTAVGFMSSLDGSILEFLAVYLPDDRVRLFFLKVAPEVQAGILPAVSTITS